MLKTTNCLVKIPLLWNGFGRFWFSGVNLYEARVKALWASQFIKIIRGDFDPDNTSILKTPLTQQLETCSLSPNLIHRQDQRTLEIEKEMKELFTTGIQAKGILISQSRIVQSFLKETQNGPSKFVFVPTVLVTRPIFKLIKNNPADRTLLHDFFGIGKTASLMGYAIITQHINKYLHSAIESEDQAEIRLLSQLIKTNTIEKTPKVLYITESCHLIDYLEYLIRQLAQYGFTKFNDEYKGKVSAFLFQTSQKKKEIWEQILKDIEECFSSARRYKKLGLDYDNKADVLFIIDEIHFLANDYKRYNREKQQQKIWKSSSNKSIEQQSFYKTCSLYSLILSRLSGRILLNGAQNLSEKLLGESTQKDFVSMGLQGPNLKFARHSLNYNSNLYQNWGQKCFKDYLWKQIQLKFRQYDASAHKQETQQVDTKQIPLTSKQMQNLFYSEMQKIKITCTWNILICRIVFQQWTQFSKIKTYNSQYFMYFINNFKYNMNRKGRFHVRNELHSFLYFSSDRCKQLLYEIVKDLKRVMRENDVQISHVFDIPDSTDIGYSIRECDNEELYKHIAELCKEEVFDDVLQFSFEGPENDRKIVFYYTLSELYQFISLYKNYKKEEQLNLHYRLMKYLKKTKEQRKMLMMDTLFQILYRKETCFNFLGELLKDITHPSSTVIENYEERQIADTLKQQTIKIQKLAKITPFLPKLNAIKFSEDSFTEEKLQELKRSIKANVSFNHLSLLIELKKHQGRNFALILEKTEGNKFTIDNDRFPTVIKRSEDGEVFSYAVLNYSKDKQQIGQFLITTYHFVQETQLEKLKAEIQQAYFSLLLYRDILLETMTEFSEGSQIGDIEGSTKPVFTYKDKSQQTDEEDTQQAEIIQTSDAIIEISSQNSWILSEIVKEKVSIKIVHVLICKQRKLSDQFMSQDQQFRTFIEGTDQNKVQFQISHQQKAFDSIYCFRAQKKKNLLKSLTIRQSD